MGSTSVTQRPKEAAEKQIPRGLKPARNDKNEQVIRHS